MAAQPPEPAPSESDLDAVLAQIDKSLTRVHARVKQADPARPASDGLGFSPEQYKKTKMAFQAMSEDSLLTDSGDDIEALPKTMRLGPPVSEEEEEELSTNGGA
jgi:hypothetical protein